MSQSKFRTMVGQMDAIIGELTNQLDEKNGNPDLDIAFLATPEGKELIANLANQSSSPIRAEKTGLKVSVNFSYKPEDYAKQTYLHKQDPNVTWENYGIENGPRGKVLTPIVLVPFVGECTFQQARVSIERNNMLLSCVNHIIALNREYPRLMTIHPIVELFSIRKDDESNKYFAYLGTQRDEWNVGTDRVLGEKKFDWDQKIFEVFDSDPDTIFWIAAMPKEREVKK